MRTSNPTLSDKAFQVHDLSSAERMTIGGTVNRTAICLAVCLFTASWAWNQVFQGANPSLFMMAGGIGGFILALITIFNKKASPITAPVYSGLEGLLVGGLSAIFELQFRGIVIQAVTLTFGTCAGLLFMYKSGMIKVTDTFRRVVVAATLGVCLVYVVSWIMSLFGGRVPMIHEGGMVGIGFSLVVVVIAAMNLVLDFDFIDKASEAGLPRYMEWYAAFGVMVTLIWLYIEILRLLAKLRGRN